MKILQVNKFLYRRAGAEAYMLDLAELLALHGHEILLWGMRPSTSLPLVAPLRQYSLSDSASAGESKGPQIFDDLLLDPIDYDRREGLGRDFKKFGRMVWSFEAAKKFEEVLKKFKPDVIHIHNIYHHISPSILAVARRHKIPVVQTLHDFKLICPNYKLFTKGAVCQRCKRYKYWNAARYKCSQDSYMASGAAAVEMWTHRALKIYEKGVARFITPSKFLRELLIGWGKDRKKILHLPNFIAPLTPTLSREGRGGSGDYILFAGRLAEEKGIWLLLEIAKALPEIKFKVAGTGPELKNYELGIMDYGLKNVELLGFQKKEVLQELIAAARLVIVPSLWYENYPMAVLEAQAAGKAVIASAIGGIPEMIKDGKTGFLVEKSVVSSQKSVVELWVAKIKQVYHDDALLEKVGQAARERVLKENNAEEHYKQMIKIYELAQR